MLPNSYATKGLALPPRRLTSAVAAAARPAPLPGPAVQSNLNGWIVPHAQARWLGPGVAWYTPQRVEQIWRQAIAGDLSSQWELFDLMESTWPCLSKCLNQIKDAVVSQGLRVCPFTIKGQKPTAEAIARAAFVETTLQGMVGNPARDENDLEDTIRDLLDARGKGISIVEVDWEITMPSDFASSRIAPRCTRWVHPVWYGYPYGPGSGLLQLRAPANPTQNAASPKPAWPGDTSLNHSYHAGSSATWSDFPEHKFIIGICKNKTGHPLGTALLHTLGFWWAASNFTAEWFLNFCQVFGQPFRWATYDPSMTPDDQAKLQIMLTSMGASAWGMFPAGTNFELKDVAAKAGDNIQLALMDLADQHCTQLILRQSLTSTTDSSGSRSLGEVHERVLGGVEESLSKWICKTLAQLVRSICLLNFNTADQCPELVAGMDEEVSPEELGKLLVDVKNAGLQPTDDSLLDLGERLGFPIERAAIAPSPFAPPAAPSDPSDHPEDPTEDSPEDSTEDSPPKDPAVSAHASRITHPPPTPDRIAALTAAYSGSMAPFRQIVLESKSRDECLTKLSRAYADWSPARLIAHLEEALQIASATATAGTTPPPH